MLSLSSFHDILNGIIINPNKIIYKSLTKNNLMEVKNLHKEWFPIDYDDNYFETIFDNQCGNYFTIGAFYNIKNKEIILGLALCEWDYLSDYFINHTNPKLIEEINQNVNFHEEVKACLKCQMYHCIYIMTIGVLDGCRKMNIGSNILNNIYNIALKDNICVGIYLDVVYYNKTAIKFYEKNHFKKVKEIKNYYDLNGKYYDANVYFRIITRKEKDEFKENNNSNITKFINRFIFKPLKIMVNMILFFLLFRCFRKR